MRRLVFMMSVSLDGFFEGPGGELDWQLVDEELHGHFNDWLRTAGAFLDGRVNYELMAVRIGCQQIRCRQIVLAGRRPRGDRGWHAELFDRES